MGKWGRLILFTVQCERKSSVLCIDQVQHGELAQASQPYFDKTFTNRHKIIFYHLEAGEFEHLSVIGI